MIARKLKTFKSLNQLPRCFYSVMGEDELGNFRASIRKWVSKDIIPNINKWEEDGMLPRYIYKQAAELGIFAPGYATELGGLGNAPNDIAPQMIIVEEVSLQIFFWFF